MRLTARHLRAALDFVRDVYARLDAPAFASHVVRALPRLVPADICSFNEIEPSTGRSGTVVAPAGADEFPGALEIFERHVAEHPCIRRLDLVRRGGAWRVSDLVSRREFERLPLYNEYYRRIGTEHQVVVALPGADHRARGLALSREPLDFSDAERAVLAVVAPHLVQAYANAVAVTGLRARTTAPEGGDRDIVTVAGGRVVDTLTGRAHRWLAEYFGAARTRDGRLPDEVARWLRSEQAARGDAERGLEPPVPLVVDGPGRRLEIRLVPEHGQSAVLILREHAAAPAEAAARLGLTPREAEVLAWVAEGKTNAEIAAILGVSARTIGKHLERIFRKLGVETRTAAARALAADGRSRGA